MKRTMARLALPLGLALASFACANVATRDEVPALAAPGGAIHGLKVLSDKVEDVSSLEAIRTRIARYETKKEQADELFRLALKFRHQTNPPFEFLTRHGHTHDPIKILNVYGYCKCCCAAAMMMGLWRDNGFPAEGWSLVKHSVSDVFFDGEWHMYDVSLMNYFVRDDGVIASSADLVEMKEKIINHEHSPFIDEKGQYPARAQWLPPGEFGDYEVIGENKVYEYQYSLGHRVALHLRAGEKLTRYWSNRGLHVNRYNPHKWDASLTQVGPEGSQRYLEDYYPGYEYGLIGNGDLIYTPDLESGTYRDGILSETNIGSGAAPDGGFIAGAEAAGPAEIVFPFASDYVFLDGKVRGRFYRATERDQVSVLVSLNHGLDWEPVWTAEGTGWIDAEIDIEPKIFRRYQHQVKIRMEAEGPATAGVGSLVFHNVVQHSQRALPLLEAGQNTITVAAPDPSLATMTLEGSLGRENERNASYSDFHPETVNLHDLNDYLFLEPGEEVGTLTFPVHAPGEVRAVRFGGSLRCRERRTRIVLQVSDDGGTTWKTADTVAGPAVGVARWVDFEDIAPGTNDVLVRYRMEGPGAVGIFVFRIDVDYADPRGGSRPVKVTYEWTEDGEPRTHSEIVESYPTQYTITAAARPHMKSLTVEGLPARTE